MQSDGGQTIFTNQAGVMSLVGGPDPANGQPPEQALGQALAAVNQSMAISLQAGSSFPVTIGGAPGLGADLSGATAQGPMRGRLVTARPAEGQLFYAFAMSAADMWAAGGMAGFERLLSGVQFFPLGSSFGCPRSLDPSYGFSPDNPIPIGGGATAPQREAAYLGNLVSATGLPLPFQPAGSQAHGDRTLNVYQLAAGQAPQPVMLYFDPNTYAPLMAPAGFSCLGAIPVGAP
jgi:hypothetical protein